MAARVARLDWDTGHFGFEIGRVEGKGANHAALAAEADAAGLRCVYLLLEASQDAELVAAQAAGWRYVDTRLRLEKSVPRADPPAGVRPLARSDHDALWALVDRLVWPSRFVADPGFPSDAVGRMYRAWVERAVARPDRQVLVADDPFGFIAIHLDVADGLGSIDLVGVPPEATVGTLAGRLLGASDAAFARAGLTRAQVPTQARDTRAVRMYEDYGYRLAWTGYWLHRWRD